MPVYEYKALDTRGKNRSGIIDAESAIAARHRLRGSGVFPVEVKETSTKQKGEASALPAISSLLKRVKSGDIASMTRQLSILLGAGVPLVASLEAYISQAPNPHLKKVMAEVKESVNEGNSFAHSLSRHPRYFSRIYINMIRAAEVSGSLDVVLGRLADFSEDQEALRGRIKAAMTYPIFMFLVGTLILFFLISFVIPNITKIFADMQQTLPVPTLVLIAVSEFFQSFWWIVLLALGAVILLFHRFIRRPRGRHIWDELKLRLPVLGGITSKIAMARFGRTLGSLLQSGVPLLSALQIVRNVVNNSSVAAVIDGSMEEIQSGSSLSAPLARSRWFPPIAVQMISVGEQSGELEGMLHRIADVYEKEVESRILSMTSMLEPVMILLMGLGVGFIVISILLPIFEMNQLIR